MTTFVDPRARMRDALRDLLQQHAPEWDDASLARFRNLLLDQTGSDSRPLADLLLEAVRRGWRERLPSEPLEPARWDAISSPFVMRWAAERFVQQEMARWAAESWGFALGVIGADQLRIALPPPAVAPPTRTPNQTVTRTPTPATASGINSAGLKLTSPVSPTRLAPRAVASGTPARTAAVGRPFTTRPFTRPTHVPYRLTSTAARGGIPPLNPKLVRTLVGLAAASYVFFLGRMAFAIRETRRSQGTIVIAASADSTRLGVDTGAVPVPPTAGIRAVADSTASSPSSARTAITPDLLAPSGTRTPGVPSITWNALRGAGSDSSRMLLVEPAKRASGASLPAAATALMPTRTDPQPYDEVQLTDGTRMTGRVDIVRAGTIIFRDMRTGLRNEINKDNIEQIITEFGTSVRFHAPTLSSNAPTPSAAAPSTRGRRKKGAVAPAKATGMRATGVAGRYRIRYAAATANGSPECTSVWKRPPETEDLATVSHIPGADTLVVAFDGGDNFPSNIDKDGYFASTPRIMPDQARTSTALVTRLSGRFPSDGSLSLTVSIVFYRRMKIGADLACTVYVNAKGARER